MEFIHVITCKSVFFIMCRLFLTLEIQHNVRNIKKKL